MTSKPECDEAKKLKREYEDEKRPLAKQRARERYEAHKKNCAECK